MSIIIMPRNSYKLGHCYWTIPIRIPALLGPVVDPLADQRILRKVAYAALINTSYC